ncbi:MAG: MFS transporter [Bowdeniella nasicola]|nr:MFS transporter [Bowdeniella nasicola]
MTNTSGPDRDDHLPAREAASWDNSLDTAGDATIAERTPLNEDEDDTSEAFKAAHPDTFRNYLRRRTSVFVVAYVGYVCAYLVRNNFKLTSEEMRLANDWTLPQIGWVLTAFTVTYGFGKFFMGMLVDRTSLRKTFAGALGISAILCILIGFNSSYALLCVLMFLLGAVQGALAPASMAMIANWYPNKTRGSGIAIWNTSQNLGGAALPIIITGLLAFAGPRNLAIAFWVPGLVVLVLSAIFWKFGGDRPEDEGMPTLREIYGRAGEPNTDEKPDDSYWNILVRFVFTSPLVLTVAFINAALYFLRFGILNWMPAFLGTEMGFSTGQYQMAFSVLEWVAIPGSFLFAWISVKLPSRQSLVGCVGLVALAGLIVFYMGNHSYPLLLICSGLMGALIYGPQLIVNILTLNFVPLKAAGVAVGFVGLFGYIVGELCANLVMPYLADIFSWDVALIFLASISVVAALLYLSLSKREAAVVAA